MRTRTVRDSLIWSVRLFSALCPLFLLHRLMTFAHLGGTSLGTLDAVKAFVVGALSDLWIAGIGGAILFLLSIVTRLGAGRLFLAWYVTLAALTALHQGYVVFFGHQFLPLHFDYLIDFSFLQANAASALDPLGILVAVAAVGFAGASCRFLPFREMSTARLGLIFCAVLVVAAVAHQRNIHYRVQWFVPEQLQMQAWERIHYQIVHHRRATDLNAAEFALMADATNGGNTYQAIVTRPAPSYDDLKSVGQGLMRRFHRLVDAKMQPAIVVVLMESQRPAETGFYSGQTPSLTPHFDSLARAGIAFTQAYAVSNVTRGAQEAVLCGYRGSAALSLMRGRSDLHFPCIPDHVTEQTAVLWLHGGDGRFDQQARFWQDHGIQANNILTVANFPPAMARTGWGIGDRDLMAPAVDKMSAILAGSDSVHQMLALILTVTNHIPWALPDDVDAAALPAGTHPSHRTTFYADAALGDLVTRLKADGRWDETLLVVMSDHGNLVPSSSKLYQDKKHADAYRSSHISFALSGGIVENELSALGVSAMVIDRPTSQASVAPFIAALLRLSSGRYMAESLFSRHPDLPVLTDLGRDVLAPDIDVLYKPDAFTDTTAAPLASHRSQIYFRALLRLVDQLSNGEAD